VIQTALQTRCGVGLRASQAQNQLASSGFTIFLHCVGCDGLNGRDQWLLSAPNPCHTWSHAIEFPILQGINGLLACLMFGKNESGSCREGGEGLRWNFKGGKMTSKNIKIDMYDLYKPLRNHLCTLNLQALLELIWVVQRGREHSVEIRFRDATDGAMVEIFRWELHLLAREALLHASLEVGQKQPVVRDLIKLGNCVRRISDGISRKTINSSAGAMRAFHLLIHQQARWQHARDWDRFYRVFRIYNRDDIHQLLHDVLGVRLSTIYTLTFAIVGGAQRSPPRILATNDYTFMGISAKERDAYFAMVGASHASLRETIKERAKYDERWAFTWNPLEASPLIQLRAHRPDEYLCPLPELLLRRVTESLFFDLARSDENFGNPYGKAFQSYVGDVLHAQFKGPMHCVLEEQEYWVKKNKKHGVDWIVSDATGHLILECKASRIRVDAKAVVDGAPLTDAIGSLTKAVVQHYKNIDDALKGKTNWQPDGKPVFPFIVTLEDWYLIAPHVVEMLQSQVHEELGKLGLAELLDRAPFIVTSISEFESAGQAIAQIGINRFCSSRVKLPERHCGLSMHTSHAFPEIIVGYQRLFAQSGQEMFGHLRHLMDLPSESEP
jgi:hypothetical protein